MDSSSERHTCLRLEVEDNEGKTPVVFVKGSWFDTHFVLSITDGLNAWTCNASESEVSERAEQWDQPVSEYIEAAEKYLGFQQPNSVYRLVDVGDGHRRFSWTFEKEGTKLEWRWKCQPSSNNKQSTVEILDFLMDANIRLSDEVVRRSQAFERLKIEAEKCLAQTEIFKNEKEEFESAVYGKFVAILNTKKSKLRELRDRLQKQGTTTSEISPQADSDSTDQTEPYKSASERSEEERQESSAGTSRSNMAGASSKGRQRKPCR